MDGATALAARPTRTGAVRRAGYGPHRKDTQMPSLPDSTPPGNGHPITSSFAASAGSANRRPRSGPNTRQVLAPEPRTAEPPLPNELPAPETVDGEAGEEHATTVTGYEEYDHISVADGDGDAASAANLADLGVEIVLTPIGEASAVRISVDHNHEPVLFDRFDGASEKQRREMAAKITQRSGAPLELVVCLVEFD